MPKTRTGPAIVNIFDATPVMYPSLFASIAGAAIEFANPVIGTSAPPPPNFAILSKTPIEVKIPDRNIRDKEAYISERSFSAPKLIYNSENISPIRQIVPPTKNALIQSLMQFERSALFSI